MLKNCIKLLSVSLVSLLIALNACSKKDETEKTKKDSLEQITKVNTPDVPPDNLNGLTIARSYDEVRIPFDAVIITDLYHARETYADAVQLFGAAKAFAPTLLGLIPREVAS